MKKLALLVCLLTPALAACSADQQVEAYQRQALASHKDKFCAMSEPERRAYLLRRIKVANANGGYVGGRYYDTTVVLSSELGAERHEWRKATGC